MIGEIVSRYRVVAKLGAGGMGIVYRATDQQLNRDVALKVLAPTVLVDESARARFEREARSLSQFNHPNICTIYEVGEANGQTYIAMELVDGRSLSELIPPGGLAIETTLRYGKEIAEALAHVHKHGLLHRDIKSSNVMVTDDGRVKLLDFGLAKRIESAAGDATLTSDTVTQEGAAVGTLAYMAPEALRGELTDERSDVWSLGIVLHEMASGSRPFQGTSAYALSSAILREPSSPLPELTPAGVRGIVGKCLVKEPNQRYQSAAEVAAALGAVSTLAPKTARQPIYAWLAFAAAFAILAVWLGPRLRRASRPAGVIEAVAVLPFENRSTESDREFFADGMTEQLITDLSKIRALRVISRASSMRYRGTQKPVSEIARELGAEVLVVGSVMRSAGEVRITAQLVDAHGDKNLWAESYDRNLKEILALQREVARHIANEIRITITPAEQSRLMSDRHVDPEVHDLVLRAMYFANKGTEASLRRGLEYSKQAISKDANYAPAHSAAAFIYNQLSTVHVAPRDVMPLAKAAAERALQLDETLAEAHVALAGVLLFYEWDWPQAERHLKRALDLTPSSSEAHLLYGNYLTTQGQDAEAIKELRLAQKLDPLSVPIQISIAFCLIGARQFDEAIAQSRRILEREPGVAMAHVAAALAHAEKEVFNEAVQAIERAVKMDDGFTTKAMAAHVHAARGDRRKAEQLLAELKEISKRRYVCAYEIAHSYVKLGDKDQAFEWLHKGRRDRADCMVWLMSEPWMDALRSDARYRDMIERIGLGTGKPGEKP
jgi:serine/threonine-protein kinase